ncbi:unnamed protein product [Paramecium pentaurelia]|uniref:RING-type domain-containing protein n=1 Tax=Paramecium pentaurelia TaxID=43138 RepID=A0A8S1UEP5_9CILI|nr:unnamed protein product [Paramecium pentaurelia]
MISDDIYWVPQGVKVDCTIDDLIQPNVTNFATFQFNFDQIKQPIEEKKQKNIEDEILELLGITEEDLLLESALQTYDHKLYIEELIQEALQDKQQQIQFTPQQKQNPFNSSFKTLYERQYLSYSDSTFNFEEEINFKTPDLATLKMLLEQYCNDKEDLEDLEQYLTNNQQSKIIHKFTQLRGQARQLVFNYIDLQQKDNQFIDILSQKLKELSLINPVKTEYLLDYFNQEQLRNILDKQIPIVRFKILQSLQKDDKLMIEYFELICQLHPDQVITELQKGGYPQDECLKLCRFYGNLKGLAYLLERSGSVLEAINLQFDLFIQGLKQQLQKNPQLLEGQKDMYAYIQESLEPTLNICRANTKRNDDESDNNWFQVLIRLTKLRQEFYKIRFFPALRCFNLHFTRLLEEVLEKTKIKSLLENLNETMKYFEFQELKSTFSQLLSGQLYELAIYGQSTMLIKQTCNKYLSSLFKQSQQGISVDIYCTYCQKLIEMTSKVYIDCKHTFHIECSSEQLCKACMNNFGILINKLLTLYTNRKSSRFQVPIQTVESNQQKIEDTNQRQNKINKLKEFDYLRQNNKGY